MKLPTFLILGAAKAGTTSLYHFLVQHPDVCMAHPKEPWFFFTTEYDRGPEHYWRRYFEGYAGEAQIGEAATRNLQTPFAAQRIAQTVPDAKLVAICRNPVERAFSNYGYARMRGVETRSFEEVLEVNLRRLESGPHFEDEREAELLTRAFEEASAIARYPSYLDAGHYAEQIERYVARFGRERVKILFFDDLREAPQRLMRELTDFLGLAPFEPPDTSAQNALARPGVYRFHRAVGALPGMGLVPSAWREAVKRVINARFRARSRPRLEPATRKLLVEHFAPHNARLSAMTGRNLEHWSGL